MSILAIDFDDVIHDKAHPIPHRRMGAPLPDAAAALSALHNAGHTLVIHTVMATNPSGQKAVEDWLVYYNVPFHEVTAIKPNADLFIDDKAIRHTDWQTTMVEISKFDTTDDIKLVSKSPKMRTSIKRRYKLTSRKR